MPKLSLIIPVYNEGATLARVLKRLGEADIPVSWELILCDDGSSDGAVENIERTWVAGAERFRIVKAAVNQGKGSALRKGFSLAQGDILGVQDADLEYDPAEIPRLLQPLLDGDADAVFGTREFGAHAAFSYWYVLGNRFMSTAASALFNRYVTDVYTCYKFFTRAVYEDLRLTATGFEIEAELTGGILRQGVRLYEIPVTYRARGRDEGKKIKASDGLRGIARLMRVRLRGW